MAKTEYKLSKFNQLRARGERMLESLGAKKSSARLHCNTMVEAVSFWLADLENEAADNGDTFAATVIADIRGALNRKEA